MLYAVVRVRGTVGVNRDIQYTMKLMRLHRVNHMVLLPDTPVVRGMLQKVKDYVTWGEIDEDTLKLVLENRLRAVGNRPVTAKELSSLTEGKYKDVSSLAKDLMENKVSLKDFKDLKPLFRLSPPKKGYEGIKRPYSMGGALGYRKKEINDLIRRMI